MGSSNSVNSHHTGFSNGEPYEPTAADVAAVKQILCSPSLLVEPLPRELIDIIIDYAEYWPKVAVRRTSTITIHGSLFKQPYGTEGTEDHENILYLQTPPLCTPESVEGGLPIPPIGEHPIRRIVFHVWSHDQGWVTDSAPGIYEYSYTWFDVIRRPASSPKGPLQPHPPIPPPTHLQRNRRADKQTQYYIIAWDWTDNIAADSAQANELNAQGRGRASGDGKFVKSLEIGDTIELWARARFPGWAHTLESAEMEVYFAV